MNSLEFIENIINNLKQLIKEEEKQIEDNKNYPSLLEPHIENKEVLKIDLIHFQQIKAELEANDKDQKELIEFRKMLEAKNDYIFELEQNVNSLVEEECVMLISRLEFYKRTVSFIKELFFIDIIELENGYFKIGFAPKEPIKNTRFTDIPTIEIAKHLKKALGLEENAKNKR